jgi:apolipoprotein D and lipocalin family protein
MRRVLYTALLAPIFLTGCCCLTLFNPLPVVEYVDVERYMGLWYEIAKYPNFFQGDCAGNTTAEYTLLEDGRVQVLNTCLASLPDGPEDVIEGTARVVDPQTNAKLKVSFFGPFEGDYWIIDLDPDYQWAVVGEPTRTFLWVLSRTPTLDEEIYNGILERLPDLGYDPDRLVLTPQTGS